MSSAVLITSSLMTRCPLEAEATSLAPVAGTCPESIAVTAEAWGWSFPIAVLSRAVWAKISPVSVPTTARPAARIAQHRLCWLKYSINGSYDPELRCVVNYMTYSMTYIMVWYLFQETPNTLIDWLLNPDPPIPGVVKHVALRSTIKIAWGPNLWTWHGPHAN